MSWNEGDSSVLCRRKPGSPFASTLRAFDPMDFLARLLMHIAQPKLHTVRYYGFYSSVARARRRAEAAELDTEDATALDRVPTADFDAPGLR